MSCFRREGDEPLHWIWSGGGGTNFPPYLKNTAQNSPKHAISSIKIHFPSHTPFPVGGYPHISPPIKPSGSAHAPPEFEPDLRRCLWVPASWRSLYMLWYQRRSSGACETSASRRWTWTRWQSFIVRLASVSPSETATSSTGVEQAVKQLSANMAADVRRHGNERSATAPASIEDSSARRVRTFAVLSSALYCRWHTFFNTVVGLIL